MYNFFLLVIEYGFAGLCIPFYSFKGFLKFTGEIASKYKLHFRVKTDSSRKWAYLQGMHWIRQMYLKLFGY